MRHPVLLCLVLFALCPSGAWSRSLELHGVPAEVETAFRTESTLLDPALSQNATALVIERRIADDTASLQEILRSFGYFQANVTTSTTTTAISFTVEPGERFSFAPPHLEAEGVGSPLLDQLSAITHAVAPPQPYWAGAVLETEAALLQFLRHNGYPQPRAERRVIADHGSRTVQVLWHIVTGPWRSFGDTYIALSPGLHPDYVSRRLHWQPGQAYDARLVDATKVQLLRTGLFSSLRIEEAHDAPGPGLPMRIHGDIAPLRTVRAGLWYYTEAGPGLETGWEHRSIFGAGERLATALTLSEPRSHLGAELTLPDVFGRDRRLILSGQVLDETTRGYATRALLLGARARIEGDDRVAVEGGLAYRLARVTGTWDQTHHLFSTPLQLTLSTVDSPLDPRQGLRLALAAEPFTSLEDPSRSFLLTSAAAWAYLPLTPRLILALRGRSAAITGTSRDRIPQDIRLYAGGPQSIRGYAFQSAGPLDADDDPEGGLAAVDGAVELRWWINDTWGIAAFVDGGGAFARQIPESLGDLFWGAGLGLRYATPIGPLRLDLAVPTLGKRETDAPFQLYLSFGQPF